MCRTVQVLAGIVAAAMLSPHFAARGEDAAPGEEAKPPEGQVLEERPMPEVRPAPARPMTPRQNIINMASRTLGLEIDDPKTGPRLDALPLGQERRFLLNVPLGGLDNPGGIGPGWKMESLFKLTDEQSQALAALRKEYEQEKQRAEQEAAVQLKGLAVKLLQARQTYQDRANAILTGADKEAKQKMDALAHESNQKITAEMADLLPKYNLNDFNQGLAMLRELRERTGTIIREAAGKIVELVPAEQRPAIESSAKAQARARERTSRWLQDGGVRPGQPGVRVPPGVAVPPATDVAPEPPKPPEGAL
jgi:hypothetical protein